MKLSWHQASKDLTPFVTGFVERRDLDRAGASIELPLAVPLLHLTLGATYTFREDGVGVPMPRACLWGGSLAAREARPDGPLHAFVAVLTFRGAALLCPDAADSAIGRRIDLDDHVDLASRHVLRAMLEAPHLADRARLFEDHLRSRASAPMRLGTPAILEVADAIAGNRLSGRIDEIASRCAMTERTFRNRMVREVGVAPKRLLRVARFNRLVRSLHPAPWGGGWHRDVGLEFFDDAHLCREFQQMSGVSPGTYVRGKRMLRDPLVHGFLLQ